MSLADCFSPVDDMEGNIADTLDHATAIRVHLKAVPAEDIQTVYELLDGLEASAITAEKKRHTLFDSLYPHWCKSEAAPVEPIDAASDDGDDNTRPVDRPDWLSKAMTTAQAFETVFSCGLHRIERLMRQNGLRARPRRRGLPKDTGERALVSQNLLDRAFEASAPKQKCGIM